MSIVTIPSAGQIGVIKDAQSQELPINAWTDASNIRFLEGTASRIEGDLQVFSAPAVTPYFVAPFATTSTRFIVHAGLSAVYVDDGTTRTDITGTAPTGAVDDRWTGGTLNGVLVLNNGVDKPMYWGGDTAANLATLTAWDSTWKCAALRPFKNYLVALDVTKGSSRYPHMVNWSAAADPGTVPASWDAADPANDAGEVDLAETSDLMVDCLPLGGANIIYKERSMYSMSYIGGQYIFQFNRLPGDVGALSRGCVASTPVGHVVLTPGDVVVHNGQGPQSIITGKMRRWLFSAMNTTYYKRCFLAVNLPKNEVWICFPEAGQTACTKALIWNWIDTTFSVRDLANATYATLGQAAITTTETWDSDSNVWDADATTWTQADTPPSETRMYICTTGPKILQADSGTSFAGTTYTSSLEKTGLALDDTSSVKTVRSIYPRIDGTTGATMYIQVGGAMDVEGPYTWSDAVTYTIGTTYKADTFASGRFIGVRIYSTASISWRVKSFDIDYVKRGRY